MCLYNIRLEYAVKSKFLHTESGEVACLERAQNSTGWDLLYNFSSHLTVLFPSRQYNSWPLLLINFNCSLALILLIIQWFKWLSIYDELKHIKNKIKILFYIRKILSSSSSSSKEMVGWTSLYMPLTTRLFTGLK